MLNKQEVYLGQGPGRDQAAWLQLRIESDWAPNTSSAAPQPMARAGFLIVRQVLKNLGAEAFYAATGKVVSLLGKISLFLKVFRHNCANMRLFRICMQDIYLFLKVPESKPVMRLLIQSVFSFSVRVYVPLPRTDPSCRGVRKGCFCKKLCLLFF